MNPIRDSKDRATLSTQGAAVLEIVGVLIGAILLGRSLQSFLGIESWKAVQATMIESGSPDFWKLARLATVEQVFKYGIAFCLFYAIGRWHRARRLPAYGFRTGGESLSRLTAIGVLLWSAYGLLPITLQELAVHFPVLGVGPDQWSLFPKTWSLSFLVYMAASSFALVPLVEELFVRGYMVTRLQEEFGSGGAILLSALFFALAHGQYFKLEVLSMGMIVSLVLGSILAGYTFLATGSLWPVIVAHALVNLPTPPHPWARPISILLMMTVLWIGRRGALRALRGLLSMLAKIAWKEVSIGSLLLIASLGAVAAGGQWLPYLAATWLLLALIGHAIERHRRD